MLPERLRNRGVEGSVIDENDYQDYARYYEEYDDDEEVADYLLLPVLLVGPGSPSAIAATGQMGL